MNGGVHRAPGRVDRRKALAGIAALAVAPAAAVVVTQVRGNTTAAEATTGPSHAPSVAASTPAKGSKPSGVAVVAKGGGPVPYVRGKTMLGAYLDLEGLSEAEAIKLRRRQTGRDPRILHQFFAWQDTLPRSLPWLPDDSYPMISWRGTDHGSILSGKFDDLIARNAKQLRRLGRPVLLRWGWEMNGDWYRWGGAQNNNNPAGYVRCWKRIREIFADQKADNVSWVWSPNWNDKPAAAWNAKPKFYPGDDMVDWVGVSGYNLNRELPGALFQGIYDLYGAKKPLMISEVGSVDRGGRTKADWTTALATWVKQHPAVGAVVWFDTDTHYNYHEKWRVDTDPESLAAFVAMAKDPHFAA